MDTLPRLFLAARFLLLGFAALLVSGAADAQTLKVTPTSVSVQTNVGTNAPSQTVQVTKTGAGALKWTVVQPAVSWVTVSPTSGTNNGTLTLTFPTSALTVQAQPYTTSFLVKSGTQSVTVNVAVTIVAVTPPPPPTLTITCPADITVPSPDGLPVVVTYTVTAFEGTSPVTPTITPSTATSGSSFAVGTTTVTATATSADGQRMTSCNFNVIVTFSPASSGWTYCAAENQFCAFSGTRTVRYGANTSFIEMTLTGGTPCTNDVFGDPIYRVVKHCDLKDVTTPPSTTGVGPRSTITCPSGALDVFPTDNIQNLVNVFPATTTFCLNPGVYPLTSPITPKTGNTFVGKFVDNVGGAILDGNGGTGWTMTDVTAGAFRAHDQDIDNVTIRNLVIRNMPRQAIYASFHQSDNWTIEFNELTLNQTGVSAPNNSHVRNNYIHHNTAEGYTAFQSSNVWFEANEIAYNGSQKVIAAKNVTFLNNFVHHNSDDGIWYDGDSSGGLVEGNVVEDNGREGIFTEISAGIIIRNNASRRNAANGIFISTSKNIQVYNNIVENNVAGIQYFLNCAAIGGGSIGWDLADNTVHDNQIKVAPDSVWANLLNYSGSTCTNPTQVAPYLNGSKNLTFANNTYLVPSLTTKYFVWGFGQVKSWSEWNTLGNDTTGSYQGY